MGKFLKKILGSTIIGLLLGVVLSYQVPQANAAVGAIFDTINRGYFVTTGAYNMTIGTNGTGSFKLVAAGTPVANIDSGGITYPAGKGPKLAVNSPVLISTPVAGTNYFYEGLNVVPATATANTAAFVGAALTPTPGAEIKIYNASASTVRAKAAGGATINGATAGGYITIATLASVTCRYTSSTNLNCDVPVALTPQGP